MKLLIHRVRSYAFVPAYKSDGASGLDLHACDPRGDFVLYPGRRSTVATGIAIALPDGYEAQVRPRSGLARDHGIIAVLGTIDGDYRGEIFVTLINTGVAARTIGLGDRIAQLVVSKCDRVELDEVETIEALGETARGARGFGSTGA